MAVVIFLGVGTNTQIGAANTLRGGVPLEDARVAAQFHRQDIAHSLQALSPREADLYRAIFAAQAKGDWPTADRVMALLSDRRLVGHVLADRYQRRSASLPELRAWLESYAALPEAADVYETARLLVPKARAKAVRLKVPSAPDVWTGGGFEGGSGFQSQNRDGAASRTIWLSGLQAWRRGDVGEAGDIFAKLATRSGLAEGDVAAAEFWAYRALKRAGNAPQAYYWLRQAAAHPRSFYGLLAEDLIGRNDNRSWDVPELDRARQAVLAASPAGWRALALVQVGRADLAEAELLHFNPQGRRDLQQAMLALADAAHMPSLALRLGGMAVNDNGDPYDAALYPLPPWKPAKGFHVDRALMYALMRRESQFDPDAVSGRGACGLMQLMPTTVRLLVDKKANGKVPNACTDALRDPVTNVSFGQTYVERLAKQPAIGDNLLLLLAAYNGGPNRAAHWMDDSVRKDPLLFIESLPVRETRNYVQQVFVHYAMYRSRLGQSGTPLDRLAHGEWPRYAMHDVKPAAPASREARADGIKIASNDNDR